MKKMNHSIRKRITCQKLGRARRKARRERRRASKKLSSVWTTRLRRTMVVLSRPRQVFKSIYKVA